MREIKFTVPGPPQGKARARTVRTKNGHVMSYTPDKTVLYENLIKTQFLQRDEETFADDVALSVKIMAYFAIPKSTAKRRRPLMIEGIIKPMKKPDIDNIIKVVLDALNGVAYHDDTQVVQVEAEKWYSEEPRIEVTIAEVGNEKK